MADEVLEALRERQRGHEREIKKQKLRGKSAQVAGAEGDLDAVLLKIKQHLEKKKKDDH
jgi:hypothetical protein